VDLEEVGRRLEPAPEQTVHPEGQPSSFLVDAYR
jgi:hypothetical protein